MPIQRAAWANELDSVVNLKFVSGAQQRAHTLALGPLFNVQNSSVGSESVISHGVIPPNAWDDYEKDKKIPEADFDKGYLKTYTHVEKIMSLSYERKFRDDNKFRDLERQAFMLGDSAMVKREFDRSSIWNNAFDSTFTGSDGVELCDAAHPHSADKPNTTQSNIGTRALTAEAVGDTQQLMRDFTDDAGTPAGSIGNLLLVPNELARTAKIIALSQLDPDSANNAANPEAGLNWLASDYLTDANNWFLIDSIKMKMMLDWFNRVVLQINPKVEDKTIQASWIAYMRYSFGWSDWKWIFGNEVS